MNALAWVAVLAAAPIAVLGGYLTVRDMLHDLRVLRDQERMARAHYARMIRPLGETEREALAAWRRNRHDREGD